MSRTFNIADLFEEVADAAPDRDALVAGDVRRTYRELDERATRLANHLVSVGVRRLDHVAIHAMNCAEWVEAFIACFKISAVPINVNYRYMADELQYLYDNADCVAVIVESQFRERLDAVLADLPNVHSVLEIGPQYEAALAAASPVRATAAELGWERSDDDLYILYTGGTTGMPKGVMWRHEDAFFAIMNAGRGNRPLASAEDLGNEVRAAVEAGAFQPTMMALGPMMHGGAQWALSNGLFMAAKFVLSCQRKFDPHAILQIAADEKVNSIATIGDAMVRPLAEALAEAPGKYDLSMLFAFGNGGAPLSAAVRAQMKAAAPNIAMNDAFGASETGAAGAKVDAGEGYSAPRFQMSDDTTVLDDDGVQCAVGVTGKLARSGHIPLGYYKDEAKTAATFPTYAGKRWVIPGDFARIEHDGTVSLLGRGSVSINSGGEKIYPEEVEAALKKHESVFDAVVVGTPNERWGEQVTAIVQIREGHTLTEADVQAHSRNVLSDYKMPRTVFFIDVVQRTPVGKADYKWAKETALALIAGA
ncbi:MAG: AMP-binding protein [Ilumatobacteraceae bacterium]|nr:AMP-binding protein [Ilumatobacteraceae bacterium]